MQAIPYDLLVDLAEGRMPPAEAAALRAKVAVDPSAQVQLAAIEGLIALMRSDESADAPEYVINRAVRLMRPTAVPTAPAPLRRIVAMLKSDSWQTPTLAAGLRSVQAWPRVLLLHAGDRELDLQVAPSGNDWQLQGQVLGPEEPGVVMLALGEVRVSTLLNELGEFVLPPVAAGRYTLTVSQGDLEIIVADLEVGSSSNKS